ncbi:hypothetical protein OG612_43180 (plasmid) [Streptomyces sp. NBC_01527]|uniref:hypothetical protein n=1 Tax=unclassified Streptomyces TaxID=2593676 RepID=UPI002E1079B4|nr:hypothetical protein OG763_45030 [Streptomyces sp. NBC_01230]
MNSYVPVPDWRAAVQRVGGQTVAGHVVEAVPAGLAVRPAGPAPIATHTWPHALPPERARPQLILASPNVPVAALAVVIAALPERIRRLLRLVSMNGRALLQTGQALADLLGSDVRVAVGAPRLLDEGGLGGASAGDATAELGMVDADGRFWRPFAQTIVCSPTVEGGDPRVRVTEWQVPPALRSETEPEALKLGEYSKAVVTPAGLWIGPGDSEPPLVAITRPSSSEDLAIDLGTPHQPLDDCLWPGLDGLFELLESEMRERIVIHVHGALDPQDHEHLLELCVRHGLRPADRRASTRPTLAAHHSVSERHDVDENHRAGAE